MAVISMQPFSSRGRFLFISVLFTQKLKVLSLPETIKEKSTFRAKAPTTNSRRRAFARNVDFSFIVSGSERTFNFRVSMNTLPTLATLVRDILFTQSFLQGYHLHVAVIFMVPSSSYCRPHDCHLNVSLVLIWSSFTIPDVEITLMLGGTKFSSCRVSVQKSFR